ncbi:RNA-binding protein Nova-1-like [Argonauta hians]
MAERHALCLADDMENKIVLADSFESSSLPFNGSNNPDTINVKILIPSVIVGAIIGKGGESIGLLQKESGARIRMTKLNDYYPGTSERVCLITGGLEAVRVVIYFIIDKVKENPMEVNYPKTEEKLPLMDISQQIPKRSSSTLSSSSSSTGTSVSLEGALHHFKILVPNSTAGRIIGKGGQYIEQIKEETGAYVQISQKSLETRLPERCVTIAGDFSASKRAIDMVLHKIVEDPYGSNFTTISYADHPGPIANANPTGSPFANSERNDPREFIYNPRGEFSKNSGEFLNTCLNINGINNNGVNALPILDNLKITLRNLGYSEIVSEEIGYAYSTLANYGCLSRINSLGLLPNFLNFGSFSNNSPNSVSNSGNGQSQCSSSQNGQFFDNSTCRDNLANQYGPIGSSSDTFSSPSSHGIGEPHSTRENLGFSSIMNHSNYQSHNGFPSNSARTVDDLGFNSMNNNSFGLFTGLCVPSDKPNVITKREIEVPETIVGAILGLKGKGIVEIQQLTNALVQISKRGVYAPGTRNRLVDISGSPVNVAKAQFLIQHRLQKERVKRAQQSNKKVI